MHRIKQVKMRLSEIFVDVHIQKCLPHVLSTHSGLKYRKFDIGDFHLMLEILRSKKFRKGLD